MYHNFKLRYVHVQSARFSQNAKSNMESVVNCTPDCAYEMKATQHPCTPSMPNTHSLTSSAFQEEQCVTSSSRQQCCKPLCSICPTQTHKHTDTTSEELRLLQGASLDCCTACMNQHWLLATIMTALMNTYIIGHVNKMF